MDYNKRVPVAWGIPMDEMMYSKFFANFFRLGYMPNDTIIVTESTYLPQARNTIHEIFIETDKEYLFMLDSDVVPPPNALDKLLKHKKDIVCGWYHSKGKEVKPCVYDFMKVQENGRLLYKQREKRNRALEKVDAVGAGCILMKRNVAEKLGKNPYNMERGGEDLDLCKKIYELGFDIYVDWDVACAHLGVFYV